MLKTTNFLTFFLFFTISRSDLPKKQTIYLGPQNLEVARSVAHTRGDTELKRIETTRLRGSFTLTIVGNKLMGKLMASVYEDRSDYTTFIVNHEYLIYTPPQDYKISSFKIKYDVNAQSDFYNLQRWYGIQVDDVSKGPLNSISWSGDTGNDDDQIEGCLIIPHLKRVTIEIEKN